jgi:transcriptional regulator with XRE-family HTH domain
LSGYFRFNSSKLRGVRERSGLRREELALAADLSASAITSFETGHTKPSLASLLRVADALGIDPSELVDESPFVEAVTP